MVDQSLKLESDKTLLKLAQQHFQAERWTEAEATYRQILQQYPQHLEALSWLAILAEQRGDPEASLAYYDRLLSLYPKCAEAHSNLGSLLCKLGRIEEAIAHQQQALDLAPDQADTYYNLGVILNQAGRVEEAIHQFQQAIARNPNYANAYNNLGTIFAGLGKTEAAIAYYQQAVKANPHHANAYNNLGVAWYHQGKLEEAIPCYEQAIALNPSYFSAYNNLGTALQKQGHRQKALDCYQTALSLNPDYASAYDNLGTVLQQQGQLEEAIAHYRRAIELDPTSANAYNNLGSALKEQGHLEEAIACCQAAIRLQPSHADAHNNYASSLVEQGKLEEAIIHYEQTLRYQPNHANAHLNLGIVLLTLGNFRRGFTEYHWRWQTHQCPPLRYPQALWDGSDLQGRVILLTAEQGFGDTIQFVRYATLVKQRGGEVVLACQRPLLRLLATVPGVDRCVDRDRVDVQTHVHIPLLDLPLMLGTTLETIPAQVPYLSPPAEQDGERLDLGPAPPDLVLDLVPDLVPNSVLKIGFVWASNPSNSTSPKRSCQLAHFLSLLELPGIVLYSLQKDPPEGDRDLLAAHPEVWDLQHQLKDFADTAAAIAQLDLVISVDTAVAHLAGALGKPVWTLLPLAPDWRWMLHREDTPWYPTMRLFRQSQAGNWDAVFAQVKVALRQEQAQSVPLQRYQCPVQPDAALTQLQQGYALYQQGNLEAAIAHYRRAIALKPDFASAYNNLGIALKEQGRLQEALAACQEAIRLQPDYGEALNACGCVWIDLGQVEAAIALYEQAIRLQPDYADAHLNLGMALLLTGDFQRGWVEYHWRWRNKPAFSLPYPEALWDGSELSGKVILLTAEQGFGDTIQFVRYASLVKQRGGEVVLACPKSLLRLLATVPGVDRCLDRDQDEVQTYRHAPLLELPRIFGTTLATIPAQVPYISAPRTETGEFSWQLPPPADSASLKIGFAWATSATHATATQRSCPLTYFLSLLELPGITLYSLQKQPPEAELPNLHHDRLYDLRHHLQDFADTAVAIAQLDLVISVDTAVAHLAGALGKPVWTLLPLAPDWRWLLHREDSPWYPTMRLFRQTQAGKWGTVFEQVVAALNKYQIADEPAVAQVRVNDSPPIEHPTLDRPQTLRSHRYGRFLYHPQDGAMGEALDRQDEWQADEINLLQHLIRPGDTVVEVGAGIGAHTVFFAHAVGGTGKVVAIEPQRLVFQTLCANLALNGLTNTHSYPLALGAATGTMMLPVWNYWQSPGRAAAEMGQEAVAIAPLDSFALAPVRLLKLNVQTSALAILQGATQTLQRCQSIVYLPELIDRAEVVAYLVASGYQVYWHRFPRSQSGKAVAHSHPTQTVNNLLGLHQSHGITVNGLDRFSESN